MYVVYLVILLISLSLMVGSAYAIVQLDGADRPLRFLWLGGAGVVVAVYCAIQLSRPSPIRRPATDDAADHSEKGAPNE
jgi:hypothetical protein